MRVSSPRWPFACGSTCATAAEGGHLKVLQWCREKDCPWDQETCNGTAIAGHLSILQWCREKNCPWNEKTDSDDYISSEDILY